MKRNFISTWIFLIRKNDNSSTEFLSYLYLYSLFFFFLEFIVNLGFGCDQGKRSVSDHIMEAVNYIKLQEKKMEKLRGARDELKKLSKSTACTEHESESGSPSRSTVRTPASRVAVQPFSSGVEIIISSSSRERGLPLSRVLDVLLQQGLSIVHCVSTTLNDQLHHTIHSDFEVPSAFHNSII